MAANYSYSSGECECECHKLWYSFIQIQFAAVILAGHALPLLFSYTHACVLASFVATLTCCAFVIVLPCWWQFTVVFRFARSFIMSSVLLLACMYSHFVYKRMLLFVS